MIEKMSSTLEDKKSRNKRKSLRLTISSSFCVKS